LIEDVLTSMKELLTFHLAEELERQDGKFGDGIILDKVPETSILVGEDSLPSSGLPVVILRGETTDFEQNVTTKKDASHNILIGVGVTDTDEARSKKRLWRTMRAVENVFEIHATNYESIVNYTSEGMDYNIPILGIEDDQSTEKGGQINAVVLEQLTAYNAAQL
jgi:hypothetical protein